MGFWYKFKGCNFDWTTRSWKKIGSETRCHVLFSSTNKLGTWYCISNFYVYGKFMYEDKIHIENRILWDKLFIAEKRHKRSSMFILLEV